MKDIKGTAVYIALAFGVFFAAFFTLHGLGLLPMSDQNVFQRIVVLAFLFIPALAAIIGRRVGNGKDAPKVWPLPWGKALRIALIVFGIFVVQTAIIVIAGKAQFDPAMKTLSAAVQSQVPTAPPVVMTLIPVLGYTFVPIMSLLFGITLFAAIALGGEYGWRGYLQPRLDEGLGELRSSTAVGLLWALWWLPLVYYGFEARGSTETFTQFAPRFILIMLLLGRISASIYRRTGHIGLSAVFLGCVYSQFDGVWSYIVQLPEYPWAGNFGIVGVGLWFVAALLPGVFVGKPMDDEGTTEQE